MPDNDSTARQVNERQASQALKKNEHVAKLRKIVASSPTKPGIYKWLDNKGEVLYVGKAKNLRSRLKSYVLKPDVNLGPWKIALVGKIADVDLTVTDTELDALILEIQLIKELKPKYNVLMKDDKNYVYVRISVHEPYPSATVVRRMEKDGALYFGPYLSAYETRVTLDMLHGVLDYRICKRGLNGLNAHPDEDPPLNNACLDAQIGKCNGACHGAVSQKEHRERIDTLIRFFRGDRKEIKELLTQEMAKAAAGKKFERAAKLRDSLKYIESLEEKQIVSDTSRENIDVIGIAIHTGKAHVVLMRERNGKLIGELNFALAGTAADYQSAIEQFIPQYYSMTDDIPDMILIPEACDDMPTVEEWLTHTRDKKVRIVIPERGKKVKLLAMAQANAQQKVHQQLSKWETAQKNIDDALSDLRDKLDLEDKPERIEGYDISHLGGTETVGSMVVVKHGKPANDQYRSFTIRTVKEGEIDDYKALKEVLTRRLKHLSRSLKEEEERWNDEGITFGKARKAEASAIEEIAKTHDPLFDTIDFDYKEFMVARRDDKELVACARAVTHEGNLHEITPPWVHDDLHGRELDHMVVRKLLKGIKKGKAYARIADDDLESYWGEIGFRHVHTPPKAWQKILDEADNEFRLMVYLFSEHKKDASLSSKPDLLVIDGGKGQLNAVTEVLKKTESDIPVIGLAKREEEVFLPGQSLSVEFEKDSQAKFLLMRLRDEAHRFANRHREKRGKARAVHSSLDDVPGIGVQTKKELLKQFGSVSNIRSATDEDLKTVVSAAQAAALRKYL